MRASGNVDHPCRVLVDVAGAADVAGVVAA